MRINSTVPNHSSEYLDELTVSPILFGIVCSLSTAGICLALFFMAFNIKYRRNRIVKMSSPNLNIVMQLGTIILFACPVLFGIEGIGKSSHGTLSCICQARIWCVTIGFTLVYGTMFSKSWRVHRIFKRTGVKRTVIRDEKLLLIILSMLAFDVTILLLSNFLDPITHTLVPIDYQITHQPSAVYQCRSEYSVIWMLFFFTYKAVTLIFGTFLSWSTRNVVLPSMNDAKCIVISIYTCVVLVALAMGISTLVWMWPNIWFSVVTTVILTCTTEVLLLQNIPKIKAWNQYPQANLSRAITASYLACSGNASFNQIEEELFLLSAENVALKKSLTEKDETIKTMQDHVQNARDKLHQLQVDIETRQDSGCDVDMSSSSTGHDDVNISAETMLQDTKHLGSNNAVQHNPMLAINGLSLHQLTRTGSLDRFSINRRGPRDRNSLRSVNCCVTSVSAKNFTELKDSIAQNLHFAHTLSSSLRMSIADELNSCRKRPMYHEMADTERDIAHVFQQSYNLDNDDVLSVISTGSVFTYDNPIFLRGSEFRLSGSSYYTGPTSRHSSFRSIASFASDFTDRSRASSISRKLKWPRYIPPQQDHLLPPLTNDVPRVVKIEMVRSTGKMNSTYV